MVLWAVLVLRPLTTTAIPWASCHPTNSIKTLKATKAVIQFVGNLGVVLTTAIEGERGRSLKYASG